MPKDALSCPSSAMSLGTRVIKYCYMQAGLQELPVLQWKPFRHPRLPPGPNQPWNLARAFLFGGSLLSVFSLVNHVPGGLCHVRKGLGCQESGFIVSPSYTEKASQAEPACCVSEGHLQP